MKGAFPVALSERALVLAALIPTIIALSLVWIYRFLPLYDLPLWMYEVRLLHEALHSSSLFEHYFHLVKAPVPNLGVLCPVYLLSFLFSIETSTKIFLSLLVAGFPWAWRFAVNRILGRFSSLAYLGFVYIFGLFFFAGQAYLMGIVLFLLAAGVFFPLEGKMSRIGWIAFVLTSILLFFVHAIAWACFLFVMGTIVLRHRDSSQQLTRKFILALIPSVVFACWYLAVSLPRGGDPGHWDLRSIMQNLAKPLGLLVKSYGFETSYPLTIINVGWIAALGILLAFALKHAGRELRRSPYTLPALVCLLAVFALPDRALGLYQPGARFVIPFLFCVTVIGGVGPRSRWPAAAFVALSILVCIYNAQFFSNSDRLIREYFTDIHSAADITKPVYSIGLDWPAGTGWRDEGSASINPLTLVPYYLYLDTPAVAWVHGTGLVRLREDQRQYQPPLSGATRQEMFQSILRHTGDLSFFPTLLIVGSGPETEAVESNLRQVGYTTVTSKSLWKILVRPGGHAATGNEDK